MKTTYKVMLLDHITYLSNAKNNYLIVLVIYILRKSVYNLILFLNIQKTIVKNNNNNKLNKYINQAQKAWMKNEISNNYKKSGLH